VPSRRQRGVRATEKISVLRRTAKLRDVLALKTVPMENHPHSQARRLDPPPTRVIQPSVLYFGTPVAILSTIDEAGHVNLTPMSSAWALGDRVVLGLSEGYANILATEEAVINLPDPAQQASVERLAATTGRNPVPSYKVPLGYRHESDFERSLSRSAGKTNCKRSRCFVANDRDCRVLSTFIRTSSDSFALNIEAVAAMNCRVRRRAKCAGIEMTQKNLESLIGILVLFGIAVMTLPAWKSAEALVHGRAKSIRIRARFDDIGGLAENAPVRCAGVPIGRVTSISLDRSTHRGVVDMAIDDDAGFPVESLASIRSAGLMGNNYVGIEPGEGRTRLANGGVIERTHSAMILEDVIERVLPADKARAEAQPSARSVAAVANRRV
jgi:outer membrane lipid asymmetry maintenance protein MlaD